MVKVSPLIDHESILPYGAWNTTRIDDACAIINGLATAGVGGSLTAATYF